VVAAIILALVGIIVSAVALTQSNILISSNIFNKSGEVNVKAGGQILDGGGAGLLMTIPNDLVAAKFTDRTICTTSFDGAAHVLQIDAGSLTTQFNGGFTTATFTGPAGTTFCWRAVKKDRIAVVSISPAGGVVLA